MKTLTRRGFRALALAATVAALPLVAANAQTAWQTAGNGTFGNTANWTNGVPVAGVPVTLPTVGVSAVTVTVNGANYNAQSLLTNGTTAYTLVDDGTSRTVTLPGANTINSGATLGVSGSAGNRNVTLTSASLSVDGALNIVSSGRVISTGATTITGTMNYASNGLLQTNTLSGTGTINNTGTAIGQLNIGADSTFAGNITSANGAISKQGVGRLTLTGTASLGAQSTIAGGSVQIGDGVTNGAFTGAISVSGSSGLLFNQASAYTFTGNLASTGTVTQNGAAITLSSESLNPNFVVSAGKSLSVAHLSRSGTAQTVQNTGAFTLDTTGTKISGATISGVGTVTKTGTGSFTLNGAQTYTGATTVSSGTLKFGAVSASTDFSVAQNATLDFSGVAPATGAKIVSAGAVLNVGGTFAAGAGSVIGGTAFGGNLSVADGGTVSPGNSPGTLAITGSFAMSGGTYTVELASLSSFDVIAATGSATFTGGTFNVVTLGAFNPIIGDFFDIVTTGTGISGTGSVTVPTGYTFAPSGNNGRLTFVGIAVVPEAGSGLLAVLGGGCSVLGGVVLRRRK